MDKVEERLHAQIAALNQEIKSREEKARELEEQVKVRKGTLELLQSIVEVTAEAHPKAKRLNSHHNSLTHMLLEIFSVVKEPLTIMELKKRLSGAFPVKKLNGNIYSTLSVLMHEGKLRRIGTGTYQCSNSVPASV